MALPQDPQEAFWKAFFASIGGALVKTGAWVLARGRRQPLKRFSVSAFVSASFHYSSPEQMPSLFSDFVPRRNKEHQDLVNHAVGLLETQGKVILAGEGGIGKSTLAYQAAATYARKKRMGLAWVSADGKPQFATADLLADLAESLHIEATVSAFREALSKTPHIVVLDNAESIQSPEVFIVLAQQFPAASRLIITTRHEAAERLRGLGDAVDVPDMFPDEAMELVRQEARRNTLKLTKEQLAMVAAEALGNPEIIRWLLGQVRHGQLEAGLNAVVEGTGTEQEAKEGPGRVFGRTWVPLKPEERTAL